MKGTLTIALVAASLALSALGSPALLGAAPCGGTDQDEKPIKLETNYCHVLEGQSAAIVTTTSGLIRRLELEALEATAEAREHEGVKGVLSVTEVEGGRLVTIDSKGKGYLRSSVTLEPLRSFSVSPGRRVCAIDPGGKRLARVKSPDHVAWISLADADEDPVVWKLGSRIRALKFSADGAQLVALTTNGYHLITEGELGELIALPSSMRPSMVEFIGDDQLAIGSGQTEPGRPPHVLIVDAATGTKKREIEVPPHAATLGGMVSSLEYDHASQRLVFGISSAGYVFAVDPGTGELHWEINVGASKPEGRGFSHARGAKRCFSYGENDQYGAAFDWDTGLLLSGDELHGFTYLAGSSDDRHTVGIKHGQLLRLDSERYFSQWRRIEYTRPLGGSVAVFSQPR